MPYKDVVEVRIISKALGGGGRDIAEGVRGGRWYKGDVDVSHEAIVSRSVMIRRHDREDFVGY
jgi:hypothetical protein